MALNMTDPGLGVGIWFVMAIYLGIVFLVGLQAFFKQPRHSHHNQTGKSSHDKGSNLSTSVMMFTMTMAFLSGFIVVGIPFDTYTHGYVAFRWIPALLFAVFGTLLVSARLIKLSAIRKYDSPIDFLNDRFRSKTLRAVTSIIMIVPMIGFMAIQFAAIGSMIEVVSQTTIPRIWGAVGIAFFILLLEIFGGLKSLTIVDVVHGAFLLIGLLFMLLVQSTVFDGMAAVVARINAIGSSITAVPAGHIQFEWILWTVPWIALPFYPNVLTMLMATRSARSYRLSLVAVTILPFIAVTAIVLLITSGRSVLPDLRYNTASTALGQWHIPDIFALVSKIIVQQGPGQYFMGSMIFTAGIACLISTNGSVLYGIATLVDVDIYRPMAGEQTDSIGRLISVFCSVSFTVFSILLGNYGNIDIGSWISLQNAVILQIAPAFIVGLYSKMASAAMVTLGMCCGVVITILAHFFLPLVSSIPYAASAWFGMTINVAIVILLMAMGNDQTDDSIDDNEGIRSLSNLGRSAVASSDTSSVSSVESRSQIKEFGKFSTPLPARLIGYRIKLDRSWDEDEFDFEDRYRPTDISISEVSEFSESYVADHARVGSTTLGSIGRSGDHNTEPIHNPALLSGILVFLLVSVPFYLAQGGESVTNGIPSWVFLSVQSSAVAGLAIIYILFSSWDIGTEKKDDNLPMSRPALSKSITASGSHSKTFSSRSLPSSMSMSEDSQTRERSIQRPIYRQQSANDAVGKSGRLRSTRPVPYPAPRKNSKPEATRLGFRSNQYVNSGEQHPRQQNQRHQYEDKEDSLTSFSISEHSQN